MQTDLYDLPISTQSDAAATAYRLGQHRLLGAEARIVEAFEDCIAHDPGFALGHVGLSRARQYANDVAGARAATATLPAITDMGICTRRKPSMSQLTGPSPSLLASCVSTIRLNCTTMTPTSAAPTYRSTRPMAGCRRRVGLNLKPIFRRVGS